MNPLNLLINVTLLVNPSNLNLAKVSVDIAENEEVSVDGLCHSSGADPPSEYRYGE